MSEQQPQAAATAFPGGAYLGHHQGHDIFEARFKKHTGMILLAQTKTYVVRGTIDQVQAAYKSAQVHNLLAGWWGIFSLLVYNWIALIGNAHQMTRAKRAAEDLTAHLEGGIRPPAP
jgi:hypothetical protein